MRHVSQARVSPEWRFDHIAQESAGDSGASAAHGHAACYRCTIARCCETGVRSPLAAAGAGGFRGGSGPPVGRSSNNKKNFSHREQTAEAIGDDE